MMKTAFVVFALIGLVLSQGYGGGSSGYEEQSPSPFKFGYNIEDENGNKQYRQEESDAYGKVKGSYGYVDSYGIFRNVEYMDDGYGTRQFVKTNEPGTANENAADAYFDANPVQYQNNNGGGYN